MRNTILLLSVMFAAAGAAACAQSEGHGHAHTAARKGSAMTSNLESIVVGGGCFWCVEAVFERIEGVRSVVAGYAGGRTANPTYDEVSSGSTGHAEVAKISFDPSVVSLEQILDVFWQAHDPTTPNRQGADIGTQYRSIILYADERQRDAALASKRDAAPRFRNPIVTEIVPLTVFHEAEDYHQNYFNNNRAAPYCRIVIEPKLKKLSLE